MFDRCVYLVPRWMILIGLIAQIISCAWLLLWFYFMETVNGKHIAFFLICVCLLIFIVLVTIVVSQFVIGTTISLLTEPISLGSAVSLFSKKVAPEVQGRLHSNKFSIVCIIWMLLFCRNRSWCEKINGIYWLCAGSFLGCCSITT